MRFSPLLDPAVVEAVLRMDVDRRSIADIWREAGDIANERGAIRPSYHSILRIVLPERRRRAARREVVVQALDELWAYRGVDYGALARRLEETRKPGSDNACGESPQSRERAVNETAGGRGAGARSARG